VQLVASRALVRPDLVDQGSHFRYWRIHSVQQSKLERTGNPFESVRSIGLDVALFDFLGLVDNLRQPLALDGSCNAGNSKGHAWHLFNRWSLPERCCKPQVSGILSLIPPFSHCYSSMQGSKLSSELDDITIE
jgi:hypothetical protein